MLAMATSLRPDEREVLGRLVEALKRELGPERADALVSDLIVDAGGDGRWPSFLSVRVADPAWVASRRAIEAFFIGEIDRDKVVLAGERLDDLPLERVTEPEHGMRERSLELLEKAYEALQGADLAFDHQLYGPALRLGYEALLAAARTALSEEGFHSKTHEGTWSLFHEHLIATGKLPQAFDLAGGRGQRKREDDVYTAWRASAEDAAEMVEQAHALVDAVAVAYGS